MSRLRLQPVLFAAAALLLALPAAAQQQNSSSGQQNQQSSPQPKKQDKKDTRKDAPAQPNAFPEEQSEKAAQRAQPPAQQQNPPAAPAPQPSSGGSAAQQNPFPEAQSEKAAKEAQQHQSAEPDNQDSSSSTVPGLKLPATAGKHAPVLNTALGRQDTKVGDFYLQRGNWKGAYDRFLEATQVNPGDAEAVYGLADSARHMGNRKVAIQNFQLYLSALPDGPRAKDCRKALKELGARP